MTDQPIRISAVLITKNEERYLTRCLHSLAWADEILVVDAESTDRTPEICKEAAQTNLTQLRYVTRKWTGFRDQRNFAIREAKNSWIFVIDADEECSYELAEKLRAILVTDPVVKAYKVRRIEFFLGKPILYGIWNPSYQDRFYNRTGVEYVNEIHEYPRFPHPPQVIHEPILHAPDFSVEKFLDKMNRYTSIEAADRFKQGQRTHVGKLLGAFPAMFLKNYFYYSAYRDGFHGLVISLLEGVSRVVRHVKLWQLAQTEKK